MVGDNVDVNVQSVAQTAGVGIVNARVSAANTLAIMFSNFTNGSLTPVSGIYQIVVCRPEALPLAPTAG